MRKHRGAYILTGFLAALVVTAMAWAALAGAARAEAQATGEAVSIPQEPYTWEQLATTAGATAATLLIVQFLKLPLDRVWKIPTRAFALGIAFALMALAQAMIRGLSWPDVPLVAVNAFVAALAAMGAYEVSFAKMGK